MQRNVSSFAILASALSILAVLFAGLPSATALVTPKAYKVVENIKGEGFYDAFDFEAIQDPTHGRVNYVNRETAIAKNLTHGCHDTFILRADHTTVLRPDGPGRDSVRLRSKKAYTNHVAVFDIRHMPQGCGTWPAVWEVDPFNWPTGGELDILEGVNDDGANAATLHTGPGCVMPRQRLGQLGRQLDENCDATINSNIGCPVKFPSANSYGPTFNKAGGGWYAVERSPGAIKVWFWSREDASVPKEVRKGYSQVSPDTWGTPTALFPTQDACDVDRHFAPANIIINLTLCGDWAGQTFNQNGCAGSCVDHVNTNPAAFKKAYFNFKAVRTYEP